MHLVLNKVNQTDFAFPSNRGDNKAVSKSCLGGILGEINTYIGSHIICTDILRAWRQAQAVDRIARIEFKYGNYEFGFEFSFKSVE